MSELFYPLYTCVNALNPTWNRRNLERQNLAQQNCANLCHGILRSKAIFLVVIVGTLGMHIPLMPAQFAPQGWFGRLQACQEITATTIQKLLGNNSNQPKAHRK